MYQWNVDTGVELWKDAAFELQYLGSKSVHLDFFVATKSTITWRGQRKRTSSQSALWCNPRDIITVEFSTYNGLTAIFRQRVNHGLSMNLSYTWAHNMDTSNDANGSGYLMNPYNIKGDYGNLELGYPPSLCWYRALSAARILWPQLCIPIRSWRMAS